MNTTMKIFAIVLVLALAVSCSNTSSGGGGGGDTKPADGGAANLFLVQKKSTNANAVTGVWQAGSEDKGDHQTESRIEIRADRFTLAGRCIYGTQQISVQQAVRARLDEATSMYDILEDIKAENKSADGKVCTLGLSKTTVILSAQNGSLFIVVNGQNTRISAEKISD